MRRSFPNLSKSRRHMGWIALLLLLPGLALRVLLPVGFMPLVDRTGIHIGFCPGEAQPPGAFAAHHHHQHGGADHGSPASAGHAPCLFALSGSAAFMPAAPSVAPLQSSLTTFTAELTSRVSVPAILRAQTPRGPPLSA